MSTKDEEDAWRSIVENYGERARLDDAADDPLADTADGPDGDARQGRPASPHSSDGGDAPGHTDPSGTTDSHPRVPQHGPQRPSSPTGRPGDPPAGPPSTAGEVPDGFVPFEGTVDDDADGWGGGVPHDGPQHLHHSEDRFVPADPPLPYVAPRRMLAWCLLVLCPATLIVCGAAGWSIAPLLKALLVAAPMGAFGYLVMTMSREPRDPFDDGARV